MNNQTKKIVMAALMAAMICVATMIIVIPSPLKGYLNMGDGVVLVTGWLLPFPYGMLAAGLGSSLADLFSGYVFYAPATFVIKGVMALIAFFGYKLLRKKIGNLPAVIVSGIMAEVIMVAGYFVFEGFMYGFVPSAINIPANGIQGIVGIAIGVVLIKVFGNYGTICKR